MNLIEEIEKSKLKEELPSYKAGDTVKVNVKVSEGNRERIQTFEDNVVIHGSYKDQWRQVGNAVPPVLAQVFAAPPVVGLYIITNRCNSFTPSLTPTILWGASLYSIMLP